MKLILLILTIFCSFNLSADTIVVNKTKVVSSVPVIDAVQYSAGDVIGTVQTLSNAVVRAALPVKNSIIPGNSGVIGSVIISDKAKLGTDIDVVFFNALPSTSFTNNTAFTLADSDLNKIICVVNITADVNFNDNSVSQALNQNCPFKIDSGTSVYYSLISRGTPTYAIGDLTVSVGIYQD